MYPKAFTDFVLLLCLDIWAFFTLANTKILNEQVITVTGRVLHGLDRGVKELARVGRQCHSSESKYPTMIILHARAIGCHSARPTLDQK